MSGRPVQGKFQGTLHSCCHMRVWIHSESSCNMVDIEMEKVGVMDLDLDLCFTLSSPIASLFFASQFERGGKRHLSQNTLSF